jgi:excisionase family DNA binding protein
LSTNFDEEKIDPTEWISQSEAARIRGISRQAISKLVKKGRIRSLIIAGHTLVNRQEVENFEPQDAGRPKARVDDAG